MFRSLHHAAAVLAALTLCGSAAAQAAIDQLQGEYALASSTTVPPSKWGFSKGRMSIRKVDERHVLILFSCEWKREPKAVCSDWYYAQQRDGGIWLQDMNTFAMRLYFQPRERKLTMIWRGADAKESVRRDIFTATDAPLTDATLLRRQQRALSSAQDKETLRVFKHYSTWDYTENRIEFQQ